MSAPFQVGDLLIYIRGGATLRIFRVASIAQTREGLLWGATEDSAPWRRVDNAGRRIANGGAVVVPKGGDAGRVE